MVLELPDLAMLLRGVGEQTIAVAMTPSTQYSPCHGAHIYLEVCSWRSVALTPAPGYFGQSQKFEHLVFVRHQFGDT